MTKKDHKGEFQMMTDLFRERNTEENNLEASRFRQRQKQKAQKKRDQEGALYEQRQRMKAHPISPLSGGHV